MCIRDSNLTISVSFPDDETQWNSDQAQIGTWANSECTFGENSFGSYDFGTLAEIQENWPGQSEFPRNKGAYYPAGNEWQNDVDARPHGGVTTGFAAVEIACKDDDPAEICQRWVNGLGAGCESLRDDPTTLRLANFQTMRFVASKEGRTGVTGVDLWRAPGYNKFDALEICGVRWQLVDYPSS